MTPDEDDFDLLRAWREEAREAPGELLDRRVLKAAQAQQARRRAVLPLAAAMAACLALLLFAQRPQPVTAPAKIVQPMAAAAMPLSETSRILADPAAMEQLTIHNMPGGSAGQGISS